MSDRPENRTQSENVDQSLLIEPNVHGQGITELTNGESEAVFGGAAINPSWAKHIDRVTNVANKVVGVFRR